MEGKKDRIVIRVTKAEKARLIEVCTKLNTTQSQLVRSIVLNSLNII